MLLGAYDALTASENSETSLRNGSGKYFELNQKSIGPLNACLGGTSQKVVLDKMEEA